MNKNFFLLVCLFLFSCSSNPVGETLSDDDEIRAAVFRYQIDLFWKTPLFKYYFISVAHADSTHRFSADADPSNSLLVVFLLNIPPVKKYSEARIQGNVFDKSTGEAGVLFRVAQITYASSTNAFLDGGEYFGPRGADGYTFYVSKRNGLWAVDSLKGRWAS